MVALAVTVVILIIISIVSIEGVIGENGIVESTRTQKEQSSNKVQTEQEKLNEAEQEYSNVMK